MGQLYEVHLHRLTGRSAIYSASRLHAGTADFHLNDGGSSGFMGGEVVRDLAATGVLQLGARARSA
jgi:hypothetical protein